MRLSSRTTAVQPKTALSQVICSLESMFRMIRGTGRRWATVTTLRSTGHVCCCENHWVMQALQKACSQCGAYGTEQPHVTRGGDTFTGSLSPEKGSRSHRGHGSSVI